MGLDRRGAERTRAGYPGAPGVSDGLSRDDFDDFFHERFRYGVILVLLRPWWLGAVCLENIVS